MIDMFDLISLCRRPIAAALFCAVVTPAFAQQAVVMVNGEPITAYDIDQRAKFNQLTTHKTSSRQEVIDELIDEKLKIKEGKRWGIEVSDSEVNSQVDGMAGRMRMSTDQLTQNLAHGGIALSTLRSRIRAETAWQSLVRGRYQSSLQVPEKDILSALETKGGEAETVAYDYTMRPILFLVPPGSGEAAFEARKKEAEGLRARFKDCQEGLTLARTMRDVAVRDQVTRSTSDMTAETRKIIESVPLGQTTAPEVTKLGIEMFAVCVKSESKADTAAKKQARDTIFQQRYEQQSKRYLAEIRKAALIEYRGK
jgi:peptidyl-prolyl cis-trans isomerase SurA